MESNANDTTGSVEHASSGAHKAIDKVSGALRPGVEHLAEDAHHAVDRVADTATQLKSRLLVGGGQLMDAQARFSAERRLQIRENPITSVALAVGIGIALGWLLRSR